VILSVTYHHQNPLECTCVYHVHYYLYCGAWTSELPVKKYQIAKNVCMYSEMEKAFPLHWIFVDKEFNFQTDLLSIRKILISVWPHITKMMYSSKCDHIPKISISWNSINTLFFRRLWCYSWRVASKGHFLFTVVIKAYFFHIKIIFGTQKLNLYLKSNFVFQRFWGICELLLKVDLVILKLQTPYYAKCYIKWHSFLCSCRYDTASKCGDLIPEFLNMGNAQHSIATPTASLM
jgi:hypothetical protein